MKKLSIAVIVMVISAAAYAGQGTHWGYSGAKGPERWGKLDPEFSVCSEGKNQSPINLTGFIESDLSPIEINYEADEAGNLAVIAVLFEAGNSNQSIAKAWSHMPGKVDGRRSLSAGVSAEGILPSNRDYYRFNGSLTPPPCSEGVWWLVMKEPVTVSTEQIEKFVQVMQHPNNRPIQPVNARMILK